MQMWMQYCCGHHFQNRQPKMKTKSCCRLRLRLLSFLMATASLFLTSSIHVATMVMHPQLMELWKCRFQHLRPSYSTKTVKQKRHPVISCNLWYFPALMMGWLATMSFIFLLALKTSVMLKINSDFDMYLLISINFVISLNLWHFAKVESKEHSKSRHNNSKYCYDNCYMCSHRWLKQSSSTTVTYWLDEVPFTMIVPPLKHKCCQKRVVHYVVLKSDGSVRVVRQLLLLAGDVETNPGPESRDMHVALKYLRGLSEKEIIEVGVQLGLDFTKLKGQRGDGLIAHEMINSWLMKNDYVLDVGIPTLKLLRDTLKRNGFGSAAEIDKDFSSSDGYASATTDVPRKPQQQVAISQTTSSCGDPDPCLCQLWHPEESHEAFKSLMKHKTDKIKLHYFKFSGDFVKSFMTREECGEEFYKELKVAAEDLFGFQDDISGSTKTKELLTKILAYQSYVNFEFLKAIIERFGNEEDKKKAKEYTEAYTQYAIERVYPNCVSEELVKDLPSHITVVFVLDTQPNFKLLSVQDFKCRLSEILGLKVYQISLFSIENGSIKVSFQIHMRNRQLLNTIPLFLNRLLFLQKWDTRSYAIQSRTHYDIKKWKVIDSIRLSDDSTTSGTRIVPATYQDQECLLMVYSGKFSNETTADVGYVDYLNEFLCGSYKNLPDVEGLYYHEPDKGLYSYPMIVIKKMKSLKELKSLTQQVSQVTQISLLLDISSSIASFENHGKYTVSVFQDSIFVRENENSGSELAAKFCPLYGHSFISKCNDVIDTFQSLPIKQLQWMSDVVKYMHCKDDSMELPKEHILKELFKQKWLSTEDRFRPKNFQSLCEELRHILETEKTLIGLKDEDDLVEVYQIHLILVGHTGVGKTSLRKHLKNEPIDRKQAPTIVMEPEFLYRESTEPNGLPFKAAGDGVSSKVFLTMWDTGGQPIFQDLLPCFARLKCMYGIVFRLTDLQDFDSGHAEIRPCSQLGKEETSPFTNQDLFFRTLAYIQAFSYSFKEKFQNLPTLPHKKNLNSEDRIFPAAVVIGTFKDCVGPLNQNLIQKKEQEMSESVSSFLSNDTSIYSAGEIEKHLIHEVDNTASGDTANIDCGIKYLRNNISECAKITSTEIPISWKRFQAKLQKLSYTSHVNQGLLSLQDAIAIGMECGVKNSKSALMYFHEIGVFMWYHMSEKRNMKQFVVIDPKILLEVLSKLLDSDRLTLGIKTNSMLKKGLVSTDFFRTQLKLKASNINDSWLIEFLEEHHLIARIVFPQDIYYFLPSLLPTRPEYYDCKSKRSLPSLYIVPQSGYIATGLFSRLLTALAGVTYGSSVWKIPMGDTAIAEVCRNQFVFVVNESVHVILSEYSKYVQVDCICCDGAIVEDDIYFNISSTLDVQLQRVVPKWAKNRGFDFTFVCDSDQCSQKEIHFLIPKPLMSQSTNNLLCKYGASTSIQLQQKVWFSWTNPDKQKSVTLWERSLKDGFLNISIVSLMFCGIESHGTTSAKNVIFQQHTPTSVHSTPLAHHEIYFRAENDITLRKLEPNQCDNIVVHSMSSSSTAQSTLPLPLLFSSQTSSISEVTRVQDEHIASFEQEESKQLDILPHVTQDLPEEDSEPLSDVELCLSEELHTDSKTNLSEYINTDGFIELLSHNKNSGKIELYHVFDCGFHFHKMREILKVLINSLSLCVVVVDNLDHNSLTLLQENEGFAFKELLIEASKRPKEISGVTSSTALPPNSCIIMNLKEPGRTDYESGSKIIEQSLSLASTLKYPFSWYLLGFKLQEIMMSSNRSSLSLEECLLVAEEYKMDRPAVEAALEHLTENNIVVYFRRMLGDTVFSSVNVFSSIFSQLYIKTSGQCPDIMPLSDLEECLDIDKTFSTDAFTILFQKLLVLATFNSSKDILVPSLLPLLSQPQIDKIHSKTQSFFLIKCPSPGLEYICMLTVFLLTRCKWEVIMTIEGKPLHLYKNAVKYHAKDICSDIFVSFTGRHLKISAMGDVQNYGSISNAILNGLETIKLILKYHQDFNFKLAFVCGCSQTHDEHTCTYDAETQTLSCDVTFTPIPPSTDIKFWLKHMNQGSKRRGKFLAVNDVVKNLEKWSNKWIQIAHLLGLSDLVISTINVLKSHQPHMDNKDALFKVVERWFLSSANPEWTAIDKIIADLSKEDEQVFEIRVLEFWNACKQGDYEGLQKSLEVDNIDPNLTDEQQPGEWNALMHAAYLGHQEVVKVLIKHGAELNKQESINQSTALVLATKHNHLQVIELLLDSGADPNIQNVHGMCPLLIGVVENNTELIQLCLRSPLTDFGIVNKEGKTAIILAVERGYIDILKLFLHKELIAKLNPEHLDGNGQVAIHIAVKKGYEDITRLLIETFPETRDLENEEGKTPVELANSQEMMNLFALEGDEKEASAEVDEATPSTMLAKFFKNFRPKDVNLLRAAKSGKYTKVETLLKSGAEPNTIEIDTLQWTPLMWASQKNHVETVKVLLKYGGDPNLTARNGYTALILASRQGNYEIVKCLLNPTNRIKADVQMKNKTRGWSALMWACQSRGKKFDNEKARANCRIVAEHLLAAGADVNSKADNGWTPIMQASQDGDVEMVKILTREPSLEIDHASNSTWTALTTACRKKHFDIIKVLAEAGADVNKKKKGGVAALHITVIKKMVQASSFLISQGADVNIEDDWGITPLMLAVKENNKEKQDYKSVIDYLIAGAKADVNLQANKYANWSTIFFAIKGKDKETAAFLIENCARMDIKDEFGHTPISLSKGIILDKKIAMHKFLTNLQNVASKTTVEDKGFSPADGVAYAAVDLRWRITQLPNYLVNF